MKTSRATTENRRGSQVPTGDGRKRSASSWVSVARDETGGVGGGEVDLRGVGQRGDVQGNAVDTGPMQLELFGRLEGVAGCASALSTNASQSDLVCASVTGFRVVPETAPPRTQEGGDPFSIALGFGRRGPTQASVWPWHVSFSMSSPPTGCRFRWSTRPASTSRVSRGGFKR